MTELERMQRGPVLSTLLRLAWPNVLAMVMTTLVGIAETYYIGRLGTTPLAAMALVFPFAMLTQMLSSGAMGGGVSSAISRAFGAGDHSRAHTLALHALVIGGVGGVLYTLLFWTCGPWFYRSLGGRDAVLDEAVRYAAVLFSGALLVWLNNTLASVLRGTGNMRVPSLGIVAAAILQMALGGVLALGGGPVPALGMVGVALGHILATGASVAFFFWYLRSGRGRLRLRLARFPLDRGLFRDILRVGALACLSPLQSVLAVLIFTSLVARLGVVVALAPDMWARLFSNDPLVLAHARDYLRVVGPAFPLFGLGLTLYFASQGAGKVLGPVLAGSLRLVLVAGAGAWLVGRDAPAGDFFVLVAVAMAAYGLATVLAVKITPWKR